MMAVRTTSATWTEGMVLDSTWLIISRIRSAAVPAHGACMHPTVQWLFGQAEVSVILEHHALLM